MKIALPMIQITKNLFLPQNMSNVSNQPVTSSKLITKKIKTSQNEVSEIGMDFTMALGHRSFS